MLILFINVMTDCIPILQVEKKFLGIGYECAWNETAIITIIVGVVVLLIILILIAVIESIAKSKSASGTSYGGSGFEVSSREVLSINPEKHQKDVFNLVQDIFKIANHRLVESRSPEYLEFVKGSNWLYGKIITKIKISELNKKLVLNISVSKSQNWSTPFKEKEIEEFNQNFDKIISDINKLVKK